MQSTIVRLNKELYDEGYKVLLSEADVHESVSILIKAGDEQRNMVDDEEGDTNINPDEPSTSGLNARNIGQKAKRSE